MYEEGPVQVNNIPQSKLLYPLDLLYYKTFRFQERYEMYLIIKTRQAELKAS